MDIYQTFLSGTDDGSSKELEYRIPIDKTQYDTLLRHIRSKSSWKDLGVSMSLNIIMKQNVRISIEGSKQIEAFCARDYIPSEDWTNVTIGTKRVQKNELLENGGRITLSDENEKSFESLVLSPDALSSMDDDGVKAIVQESQFAGKNKIDLQMYKKLFRLRQRNSFTWRDQVRIDLTKVKENKKKSDLQDRIESQYVLTMKDAELGKQPLRYELEVEVLSKQRDAVDVMKSTITSLESVLGIKDYKVPDIGMKAYRLALRSLLDSHFNYLNSLDGELPESSPKTIKDVVKKYMGGTRVPYIIPKLVSMTREDLPIESDMAITDKADGDSCILLVYGKKCYCFDSGFQLLAPVRDLGMDFPQGSAYIFAGEFLNEDKSGLPHKTAYLYDCYMWQGDDVRRLNLVSDKSDESTRIQLTTQFTEMIQEGEPSIGDGLRVRAKKMLLGDAKELSKELWSNRNTYPYVLDGIIFTPAFRPVGQSDVNQWEWGYKMDRTWNLNYKWKPPEYNSIDFLLVWSSGITKGSKGLVKKAELRTTETVTNNGVRCVVFPLFRPSEYVRPKTYQIEVPIDASREPKTEEDNEYIANRSIVECRYDMENESWIVLRNRKDKTVAWNRSLRSIEMMQSKLSILVTLANKGGRSAQNQWKRNVLQNIRIMDGVRVAFRKQKRFEQLRNDLVRFLLFHSFIKSDTVEDKEIVMVCQSQKDSIMELLNDRFTPTPLTFGVSGSNNTFVANTIWKSIHEPILIDDFDTSIDHVAAASGAGEDRTVEPSRTLVTQSQKVLNIPIKDDVNVELAETLKSLLKENLVEVSDRDTALVDGSILWTSKVSLPKTDTVIRGDVRKFTTGWLNKEDKKTWFDWKKSTGGASSILTVGIPGILESSAQRKGLVKSLTNTVAEKGRLFMLYWDHSKIADILSDVKTEQWKELSDDVHAKKHRGGHLSIRKGDEEFKFYSWDEEKFVKDYTDSGWKIVKDVVSDIDTVLQKDPITNFMSLMVLEH